MTSDLLSGYHNHRYKVVGDFGRGIKVILYRGGDYDRAVEVANFWDERIDVWFTDVERLPFEERLQHRLDYMERRAVRKLYSPYLDLRSRDMRWWR